MTLIAEPLAAILKSEEQAELALTWFKRHLQGRAEIEASTGNPEGATTLNRVAYDLEDHE